MPKNPFSKSSVPATHTKSRWVILPFFWKLLKGICFTLGLSLLLIIGMVTFTVSNLDSTAYRPPMPKNGVLYIEFKDRLNETPPIPSFSNPFAEKKPTVHEIVTAIDNAATDERIQGIAARMYEGNFGLTQVQEIREAVQRFKQSGKFTKIYSTSFGGSGNGTGRFYLASVFDERWMQPMGVVGITGVRAEIPFIKSVLDKIGISPEFIQKKDYKTAYESVMRDEISPQNKAMMSDIVNSIQTQIMTDIPRDLDMPPARFQALVDRGLLTSDEALKAGLITRIAHADQMADDVHIITNTVGKPAEDVFTPLDLYLAHIKHPIKDKQPHKPNANVALIYVAGTITNTNGEDFARDGIAAAEIIAPAIMDAAENEHIKTIILRVDSPGGSPSASESILRAVEIAKAKNKKVIVSMASVAASGGYWVSAYADRIFALPNTLTGSIGVVGGKIALEDLWDKIGVNWNKDISWGDNAGMWSMNTEFSQSERARMNAMLDHVYDNFLARVATGRGISTEQVEAIAQGRVWTGAQAVQNGLVDQLGGLHDVMTYVATDLGLAQASDLTIAVYPKPKTFSEEVFSMIADSGMIYSGLKMQGAIMSRAAPFINAVSVQSSGIQTYEGLRVQ